MLAIQKVAAAEGLARSEVDKPSPGRGEVLVEVDAAGICGSDVHIYEWTTGYDWMEAHFPVTLGHEFAGRVVELGADVDDLVIGERVAVLPDASCGLCDACTAGRRGACRNRVGIGMRQDGGFARFVAAPAESCLKLPEMIDAELGALIEPLAVGAQAVEIGDVGPGDNVVVLGAGMIGLSIALMARITGAQVAIFGLNDGERLQTAETLGFRKRYDLADIDLKSAVADCFAGKVDRVFEATGAPVSITDGLAVLKRGGILVTTGIHARPLEVNLTTLVRMRHQIRGSHAWTRDTWDLVIDIMRDRGEEFRKLITHRLPLSEAIEGFALARSKAALKVMLLPGRD